MWPGFCCSFAACCKASQGFCCRHPPTWAPSSARTERARRKARRKASSRRLVVHHNTTQHKATARMPGHGRNTTARESRAEKINTNTQTNKTERMSWMEQIYTNTKTKTLVNNKHTQAHKQNNSENKKRELDTIKRDMTQYNITQQHATQEAQASS